MDEAFEEVLGLGAGGVAVARGSLRERSLDVDLLAVAEPAHGVLERLDQLAPAGVAGTTREFRQAAAQLAPRRCSARIRIRVAWPRACERISSSWRPSATRARVSASARA